LSFTFCQIGHLVQSSEKLLFRLAVRLVIYICCHFVGEYDCRKRKFRR